MKLKKSGNDLFFMNQQEDERFAKAIINTLSRSEAISVEKYIMGPSEDVYDGVIKGHRFQVVFDLNYGCWFHSDDGMALDLLIEYFNEASE